MLLDKRKNYSYKNCLFPLLRTPSMDSDVLFKFRAVSLGKKEFLYFRRQQDSNALDGKNTLYKLRSVWWILKI